MKEIKNIAESKNYTAVNIGLLDELSDYSMVHPKLTTKIEGKVFVKEATKATGTEISFQSLPPHSDLGYFHTHEQNEETYIILKGSGEMQIDDDCFPVGEGSIVRVAPEGKRRLHNTTDSPMIYMVIQSKQDSLEQWSTKDGSRVKNEATWNK